MKSVTSKNLLIITVLLFFVLFNSLLSYAGPGVDSGNTRQNISVPDSGCYVGVFPGWGESETNVSADELAFLETIAGKGIAMTPFSNNFAENASSIRQIEAIKSYGAIPLLRLLPWSADFGGSGIYQPDYSLQKIIDGDFDSFLAARADEIKPIGPIMVTFGVEMNGNWFPWSGIFQGGETTTAYGDKSKADGPERYVDAYRHIVILFNEHGADNVTWYFHANFESIPEESWNSVSAYYPGDEYVDWVGTSVYGPQYIYEDWISFEANFQPIYSALKSIAPAKPVMIPEWGVADFPAKGSKPEWYTNALTSLQTRFTDVKIAIVYHEQWENEDHTTSDLRINSSIEAQNAYQAAIVSDYFIENVLPEEKVTKTIIPPMSLLLRDAAGSGK
jgi:hypothetical protein